MSRGREQDGYRLDTGLVIMGAQARYMNNLVCRGLKLDQIIQSMSIKNK